MDVGTAKPTPAERARLPHHLIDIIDPTEAYSAARFRADALAAVRGDRGPRQRPAARRRHDALLQGAARRAVRPARGRPAPPRGHRSRRAGARLAGAARRARARRPGDRRTAAAGRRAAHPARARGLARDGRADVALLGGRNGAPPLRLVQIALVPGDRAVLHRRIAAAVRADARRRPGRRARRAARALRAARRPAVDALRGLPAGVGASRRRVRPREPCATAGSSRRASSPSASSPGCARRGMRSSSTALAADLSARAADIVSGALAAAAA